MSKPKAMREAIMFYGTKRHVLGGASDRVWGRVGNRVWDRVRDRERRVQRPVHSEITASKSST